MNPQAIGIIKEGGRYKVLFWGLLGQMLGTCRSSFEKVSHVMWLRRHIAAASVMWNTHM